MRSLGTGMSRSGASNVAVNFAPSIDDNWTGFDTDACVERWLARTGVHTVDLSERALDGEGGPRCAFSVVFLSDWITEQGHQPIAQLFGDMAAHLGHGSSGSIQILADQIAPVLRIKPRRDAGRTYKIAEHNRDMSALASLFRDRLSSSRHARWSPKFN